jgi:predicted peptidase
MPLTNNSWWSEPAMEELALATLAAASKEFRGDPKRTYLTGLSMGGYGSWAIAAQHPNKFAAIAPVCGGIVLPEHLRQQHPEMEKIAYADDPKSYADVAAKIGKTPVWIFHGGDDPVVPLDGSRKLERSHQSRGLSFMTATSARRYRQDRRAIASIRQINACHSRRDSCSLSRVTSHEPRITPHFW